MAADPGSPVLPTPGEANLIYAPAVSAPTGSKNSSILSDVAGNPFAPASSEKKLIYAAAAPAAPAEEPAEAPTLQALLAKTPAGQSIQDAKISVSGWIEASYQFNFLVHGASPNKGRAFDGFENNRGDLNQLNLTFERTVDLASKQFDVGGRVDLFYGGDARFTTSSGFFDHQGPITTNPSKQNFLFPRADDWFDIPQLYVDIAVPYADGVRVRIGKFEFFKPIDPNKSIFYTHPLEFNNGFPYTLTGVSLFTPISKQTTVEAGISRGWNQTLRDNNSAAIDVFGRVISEVSDVSTLTVAGSIGPDQFHNSQYFTFAFDVSYVYIFSEKLKFLVDLTYGHQGHDVFGQSPGTNSPPPASSQPDFGANWYGINAQATYKINDYVSASGRAEWYRDEEGATLGVGEVSFANPPGVPVGNPLGNAVATRTGANFYELTVGLNIKPLHDTPVGDSFMVRPEIRYDYASRDYFRNFTRHDQLTFAIDAIFNF
jgi:hypothetical protein